jgi:hypothetical protein
VDAGHGKFITWLVWTVGGMCALLAVPPNLRPVAQVFVWLWMGGVVGLPAWWFYRAGFRRRNAAQ